MVEKVTGRITFVEISCHVYKIQQKNAPEFRGTITDLHINYYFAGLAPTAVTTAVTTTLTTTLTIHHTIGFIACTSPP